MDVSDNDDAVVSNFVTQCKQNHLQLNIMKTKELVVDLMKDAGEPFPLMESLWTLEEHKHIGVVPCHALDWAKNTDVLYKKGRRRFYVLKRLKSFNYAADV